MSCTKLVSTRRSTVLTLRPLVRLPWFSFFNSIFNVKGLSDQSIIAGAGYSKIITLQLTMPVE